MIVVINDLFFLKRPLLYITILAALRRLLFKGVRMSKAILSEGDLELARTIKWRHNFPLKSWNIILIFADRF